MFTYKPPKDFAGRNPENAAGEGGGRQIVAFQNVGGGLSYKH